MTGTADRPVATPVQVVPYDERWPGRAAAELAALRAALGPLVRHADHIGSTAVPGMAAKDVLDLQLSVRDLDAAAAAFGAPLAALGYTRLPFERDHVPAGDDSDPALWVKRYWHRRGHPAGDVNLHVRIAGSPNERLALLFRDWLRAHPPAIAAYARFKAELARAVVGLDVHTEIKDPVVDLVVAAAAGWARDTAWQPHADRG
ncbi:MAG: GrpB family protein [Streptosporangiaceae bacterium]